VQEIDLFDFIAGQVQELALADGDDLQMGFEQRIIPRPQRGQETIASVLVLIWIHVGPTSPSARDSTPTVVPHAQIFYRQWIPASGRMRMGVVVPGAGVAEPGARRPRRLKGAT